MWHTARAGLVAFCFVSVFSPALRAQQNTREEAKAHYEKALELLRTNHIEDAAAEFERAYALSPHYAVLYNLGKAYAFLHRPIDALKALRGYLQHGGSEIDAARRAEVEELTNRLQGEIARIKLQVEPAGSLVKLNDAVVGTSPIEEPVPALPGDYELIIEHEGFSPFRQAVHLATGELKRFSVSLPRLEPGSGTLGIECALVDVAVSVDDKKRGMTPLDAPIRVPAGRKIVRLTRDGYAPQQIAVDVAANADHEIRCNLVPLRSRDMARLRIAVSEPGASISVDGKAPPRDGLLPAGRHRVVVEHAGFWPWSAMPRLTAGRDERLAATLVPTPEYRRSYEDKAQTTRTWAFVAGAGGTVLLAAASGIAFWNEARYDDWQQEDRDLEQLYRAGEAGTPVPEDAQVRQNDNDALLESIKLVDRVTVTTAIVGAASLATGIVLWVNGPSPNRYKEVSATLGADFAGMRLRSAF